jgi:hypothetical protein
VVYYAWAFPSIFRTFGILDRSLHLINIQHYCLLPPASSIHDVYGLSPPRGDHDPFEVTFSFCATVFYTHSCFAHTYMGFLFLLLLYLLSLTSAKVNQQCRLRLNRLLAGTSSTSALPTATSGSSISGSPSDFPSSTTSGFPSRTPFNYGHDIIRGVNLSV